MPSLRWESCSQGNVPNDAVCGGWNAIDQEPLFVGRATYRGSVIVGKVSAKHKCCYYTYGGRELQAEQYEVLVNSGNRVHLEWLHDQQGNVPAGAVEGGRDEGSAETYYIGRHSHLGDTIPGKIQKSQKCLYIPYGRMEIVKTEYNVLVQIE